MDQHPGGDGADLGRSPGGDAVRPAGPLGPPPGPTAGTARGASAEPVVPARIVLPTLVGALAAVAATGALWWGASHGHSRYAAVVLAVQVVLVAAWCVSSRPPAVAAVAGIGVLAAVGADAAALWHRQATADPLVAVVVGAFLAAVAAQLARGAARRNVTEALGATLAVVVAVVALATTVSLHRREEAALLTGFLLVSGVGVAVARLTDLAVPRPAVHEAVPRGVVGIVVGGLVGGLLGGLSAALTEPLPVWLAAIAGWFVATAAVLADLAVDYAGVGRALAHGRRPTAALRSMLRAMLGPLFGLAIAAPAGYVFGLVLLS